jgi:probable DNA repair protein
MIVDPLRIVATGGGVLTVNKRLARQLVRRYDQQQVDDGLTVWPTPAILSLDAWTMRLLQQLRMENRLLTDAQSQHLWEEIVTKDVTAAGRDLLQVPQAARRASEAHRLLSDYLIDFTVIEADEDHLAFLRWRKAWQERLRRESWLDRADIMPTVTAALATGQCQPPSAVVLAGFDELSPVVRRLCAALEERGCRVTLWEPSVAPAANLTRHGASDRLDEVRSCARWVRLRLEHNPRTRVGVVVPRLADYQGLIERIFRAELDPPGCLTLDAGPESFSLSLGTPLADEGVVRAALRLLSVVEPIRLEDIGWLLRSPYLGGARPEGAERARADRLLRKRGRSEWRLAALVRILANVPRMAALVTSLQEAGRDSHRRLPGEWAEYFANLLERCGWPGDRGLSSREFQAIRHVREVLGQLAALDRVSAAIARGQALATFKRLAVESIFQPEGGEGRVQVLGLLEAAGLDFDALWVLGLHEGAFPSPPRPNPFLPLAVQSRLRMPHADARRERQFAEQLGRRLFAAAPEVVVSWPRQHDGASLRHSPLLGPLPTAQLTMVPSADPFHATCAMPCLFETVVDDQAMALPVDKPFSGGTNILKDQALCPFRAFAHHRLHAEGLESPDIGLDNRVRGNLVHGVLEKFWRQVAGHQALLELDQRRQGELLTAAAEEALLQHERRSRCDLPRRLRVLESRRLVAMASVWLEIERRRLPFRIAEIEQRHDARVGRLRLRTRIDRIDALPGERLAVIDYKTGRPDPGQWLDPRVTEPQLPL